MRLYNQNIDMIGDYKTIPTIDGILYVDKLTEQQLNNYGYFPLDIKSQPSRRYYTYTEQNGIVNGKYVMDFNKTERPLKDVKDVMIKDLFEMADYKEKSAILDTGLGFKVKATESDLNKFERGSKRGFYGARDINGDPHPLTKTQMDAIALAIEDNGMALFNTKWAKFDEIKAMTTITECINYENFEYQYTITQADVDSDIEGLLTVGQIVTRTKNKVKDW